MKSTRWTTISLLTFVLCSCTDNKENATQHFDSVQQAITPFVELANKMGKETLPILKEYYDNGQKLAPADSLIVLNALNSFNIKSEETLKQINNIKEFKEFDLKKPTSECVEKVSKLIRVTFGDMLQHSYRKDLTPDQLENQKKDFQKEFFEIRDYYFKTQDEFQRKFGIE